MAAQNSHHECLQILITNGADVNAQLKFDGATALHIAAQRYLLVDPMKILVLDNVSIKQTELYCPIHAISVFHKLNN